MKELLFSQTKNDFEIEYFSGSGAGGQNRNKVQVACRVRHRASGAVGQCQEERTQKPNRERAFKRCVESDKFQKWLKIETARQMGDKVDIDKKVEEAMKNVKFEVHDEKGRWVEAHEEDLNG